MVIMAPILKLKFTEDNHINIAEIFILLSYIRMNYINLQYSVDLSFSVTIVVTGLNKQILAV